MLVIGALLMGVIDSLTTGLVVVDATSGNTVSDQLWFPDINLYVVLGGLVFISFARLLRSRAVRFSTLTALCDVLECSPGDLLDVGPRRG